MNRLVLLALVTVVHGDTYYQSLPVVTPEGFLAYTPEVAAARAAHLSAVHQARAGVPSANSNTQYYYFYPRYLAESSAAPYTVDSDNVVFDNNDVAAAKVAHYAEKVKAVAAAGLSPDHLFQEYHNTFRSNPFYKSALAGNQANSFVIPERFLADTPEVAAARQAHLAAYAKVLARG